ncbi:hypothetical protein QOZ84_09510 [Romboutsia sedimentorum]|uniref:Cell shape-determining protein n=1 Tax=Romboutsia sedimentorum TaxID=1368474 RepID=A0ABT7EE75_9FIRM|nr:hypothetical protein [Romboutsia sedimentorum]MDK2563785.1 hypothetical protein [Romboutsia sedimentorum]MDK2585475.1 hypothetical protein [Romboutsia sedimentorum]
MKKFIKTYGIAFIVVAIYSFVKLPVLSLDFISCVSVLIIFFGVAGILDMMLDRGERTSKTAKYNFSIAIILIAYSIAVPFLASTPVFHAKTYKNLLGTVKESEFSKDVSPVSVNDIRLVDEDMAMKLGDKKLGEDPALGSVSKLGKFHIQSVKGELYWVAPLVHRDIIKWVTSLDGTKGYVMVSASNPQDVRLVQKIDNKPVKIVYQPEAYLLQDLHRHMYIKGIVNAGMTDFTLEINDEGRPYWVTSLYEHKIGYGGANAVGVATVDAETGETKRYTTKEAPKWIDRIQPQEFVTSQINDWGLYVKGFLNSVISEEGVLVPTEGTSLVYGNDNKAYWYTGITSSGGDESTIGFMLVDTRTKEAKLYKQPGATETAAMRSAEGKVQEKNYEATFPVMYNMLGTPTYVSSLKDKAGLVKMVAFISVEDFSVLGLGESKEEALRNYREALASKGNTIKIDNDVTSEHIEGTISRISADVKSGNTFYYMTINENQNIIFNATSKLSIKIPLTSVGDKVKISYQKGEKGFVDIIEFDNLTLGNVKAVNVDEKIEEKLK